MKKKFKLIAVIILVSSFILTDFAYFTYCQEPVDYVNPNIGSIGHLLKATTPDVQMPRVHNFEKRQSVAVTLEHSYDDWCMAQMAKSLNKNEDYDLFINRANNYKNLYDQRVGFMAPKTGDGKWVFDEKGFDPIWSGGQGGRDYYTETNAWTYTFHV